MVYGDAVALTHVDELAQQHPELPRLQAVRGHLLERLVRTDDAATAYRQAIRATHNTAEGTHLRARFRRPTQSTMDISGRS